WFHDLVSRRLTWSPLCASLRGIDPSVAPTFQLFAESIHPDDRGSVMAAIKRSLATGEEFIQEYRCLWPDGSVHWLRSVGRAYHGAHGRPTRMAGIVSDITERKSAEEKLRRTEAQYLQAQK